MEVRRYKHADIPQLLDHIGNHLKTTRWANLHYDRPKIEDMLVGNINNTQFFCDVVIEEGKVVGGLCASINTFIFSHDAFAVDHLLLTVPGSRQAAYAASLVQSYIDWAKKRKVKEIQLRNATGNDQKQFAGFAEKLGFRQVGSFHVMELSGGD